MQEASRKYRKHSIHFRLLLTNNKILHAADINPDKRKYRIVNTLSSRSTHPSDFRSQTIASELLTDRQISVLLWYRYGSLWRPAASGSVLIIVIIAPAPPSPSLKYPPALSSTPPLYCFFSLMFYVCSPLGAVFQSCQNYRYQDSK